MIFYREEGSGEVYAYSPEDVDAGYVREGLLPMTEAEVESHLHPVPVWWTDGNVLLLSVNGDVGWHLASEEEISLLMPLHQLKEAQTEVARLRKIADSAIAPLQDAVDIEEATPEEVAALTLWKKYRVALNRLPDQEGYPTEIDWPAPPA